MVAVRTTALAALLLVIQQSAAFVAPRNTQTAAAATTPLNMANNNNDDPTQVWYAKISDTIQNVLTSNSPLNEGKKALVRSLAGDYDQAAVQARLNGLIREKPVLMLSFRT